PGWWGYPCRRYAGRRRARVSGDGRRRGPRPPRPAVRANASWRNLSHARLTTNQRSPSMTLMSPLSIVVMGAGGVGGYFGARLALAGGAAGLRAGGPPRGGARRDGVRFGSTPDGERLLKIAAVEPLADGPPADAVLFCVKSYDTESAAAALSPTIGPETAVVS